MEHTILTGLKSHSNFAVHPIQRHTALICCCTRQNENFGYWKIKVPQGKERGVSRKQCGDVQQKGRGPEQGRGPKVRLVLQHKTRIYGEWMWIKPQMVQGVRQETERLKGASQNLPSLTLTILLFPSLILVQVTVGKDVNMVWNLLNAPSSGNAILIALSLLSVRISRRSNGIAVSNLKSKKKIL